VLSNVPVFKSPVSTYSNFTGLALNATSYSLLVAMY